jgi:hypothetical protein
MKKYDAACASLLQRAVLSSCNFPLLFKRVMFQQVSGWRWPAVLAAVVLLLLSACSKDQEPVQRSLEIALRYIPSHENETWDQARTGLLWSFSFLGATLPPGSFDHSITWQNETVFLCNLAQLGFSDEALDALEVITERLKTTEEYSRMGGIDFGRFLMLTVYSSHHYYRITGMSGDWQNVSSPHLGDSVLEFAVTQSTVANGNRLIRFPSSPQAVFYSAEEGSGKIADGNFVTHEFETFDLMPNGQLRFAVFDKAGKLKPSGDPMLSVAGKPGKCLWCHESKAQPLFTLNEDVPGYFTSDEFTDRILLTNEELKKIRETLATEIVYANEQDHTLSEILYVSFLEPSASRLAKEWGIAVADVELMLAAYPTHSYAEFPFLGSLYYRNIADSLAPYLAERVPESAREVSSYEPDFF